MIPKKLRPAFILLPIVIPVVFTNLALADNGNVVQVEGFIRSVIQAIAGLAGLIATGFFVVGGFKYITSSGNPQHLEKAKRTILFSAAGLAITIGAFVLSNIINSLATNAFGG